MSISIGNMTCGDNHPLLLIAGPCQIESLDHALLCADRLKTMAAQAGMGFVYKSSYDKANRTSAKTARGVGIDAGLDILARVKATLEVPVLTDVHTADQCAMAAEIVDIIQIPAFLCRQTDLLIAAAETQKIVNIKKGQFLAPWDMLNVIKKVSENGNNKILLTERGTSFGYNTLVSDMRSIPQMSQYGFPVIFDATHSVQQPGGLGLTSGGQSEFVPYLSRAAVSIGIAGLFVEVHEDPENAPSDGPNMLKLSELKQMLSKLVKIDKIIKL